MSRKMIVTAMLCAIATAGAVHAQSPTEAPQNITGSWSLEVGTWESAQGAQVNMTGAMHALVFRTAADTVIANYKTTSGALSTKELRGVWAGGKLHLTAALPTTRQDRDESGNVTSESQGSVAHFELDLAPDGAELKGTLRLITDRDTISAPISAKREVPPSAPGK